MEGLSLELLSHRERSVVELAASGLSDKEIALELQISKGTLTTYWARIRRKCPAKSRSELVALFVGARVKAEMLSTKEGGTQRLDHNAPLVGIGDLLSEAPFPWVIVDTGHWIVRCNAAFATLIGHQFRPASLIGTNLFAYLADEDLERLTSRLGQMDRADDPSVWLRWISPEGSVAETRIWRSWTDKPSGTTVLLLERTNEAGFSTSQQNGILQALAESARHSKHGAWFLDVVGGSAIGNEVAFDHLGLRYPPGKPYASVPIVDVMSRVPPEDREAYLAEMRTATVLGEGAYDHMMRVLHPQVGWRTLRMRMKPLLDSNKNLVGHVGWSQDVTETGFETKAPLTHADLVSHLLRESGVGFVCWRLASDMVDMDFVGCKLLGLAPDGVPFALPDVAAALGFPSAYPTGFRRRLADGPDVLTLRARVSNGQRLKMAIRVFRGNSGTPLRLVAFVAPAQHALRVKALAELLESIESWPGQQFSNQ